jgi:hypothetical protein
MQQGKLTQEKTIEHLIYFSANGASFFLELLHYSDNTIERKIFSLHDGATLHGP